MYEILFPRSWPHEPELVKTGSTTLASTLVHIYRDNITRLLTPFSRDINQYYGVVSVFNQLWPQLQLQM